MAQAITLLPTSTTHWLSLHGSHFLCFEYILKAIYNSRVLGAEVLICGQNGLTNCKGIGFPVDGFQLQHSTWVIYQKDTTPLHHIAYYRVLSAQFSIYCSSIIFVVTSPMKVIIVNVNLISCDCKGSKIS